MKHVLTYFLTLLIAVQSLQSGLTLLSFYANRAQIASEQCVNRFSAISNCKGSCVLKKQLAKASKNEEEKVPMQLLECINFYAHSKLTLPQPKLTQLQLVVSFTHSVAVPQNFTDPLFRPPTFSAVI